MSSYSLETLRHSASHILAQAVLRLYPKTKLGIGPATNDGFYYDFLFQEPLKEEDLSKIESQMHKIISQKENFEKIELTIQKAKEWAKKENQTFKKELIDELAKNGEKKLSFYKSGEFLDLCSGPHVENSSQIGYFKLLSIAGAYWRGSEKNQMLTRIYSTAFSKKEELDKYLKNQDEIRKRDHRKLGAQLELFRFEEVAPGAPFWLPKGMSLIGQLEKLAQDNAQEAGYEEIRTPVMASRKVFETSGHWDFFGEHNMYNLALYDDEKIEYEDKDKRVPKVNYCLKPMNCPESTYVYKAKVRSYKDLPLGFSEIGTLHRRERSGTLAGLLRVRQITMDDAHIYLSEEQIKDTVVKMITSIQNFYKNFDFVPEFKLATRPNKALGDPKVWEKAEKELREALKSQKIKYDLKPKDGAFYGPKIDAHIEDALGREWQLATIQLDFQMPSRFALTYIDKDGSKKTPIVIHRAIFGSLERFLGVLIEHYGGNFPLWLAPLQVIIIPITNRNTKYAKKIQDELTQEEIRCGLDERAETMQSKIRDATIQKIPYLLIVGDREEKNKEVSQRLRDGKDLGVISKGAFIKKIKEEIAKKGKTC